MTFNRLSLVTLLCAALAAGRPGNLGADTLTLSDSVVRDKIKGGWVGQVVGCTFGGPTEFRWLGTWIQDYTPIRWDENLMLEYFENGPGLYDDIYMDLSFMSVLADKGLGAPLELLAKKYADAGFQLWHANQAGRWNILHGVMPPASGHWQNNPHADDIDFQIESDFIGLICPGMPQSALELADKVGHIMNYGDGVYGGYYVSAMYTQAFVEKDIVTVVEKALASLPAASRYHRCISDVLAAWRAHPEDWRECWFEVQKNYADDVGCPHGALNPFNIDAVINGAYITIGLLYGGGDFGKTLEIATRCGQDSDCNPSNAGGVLGALLGFEAIPERWKLGLDKVENLKFSYSDYSLTDIYAVNHRLAAEMVKRGGGAVTDSAWTIQTQQAQTPQSVEVAFEGLKPVAKDGLREVRLDKNPYSATFSGRGFVIDGNLEENRGRARCEVRVDGKLTETVVLEGDSHNRRTPLFWNYGLADGDHQLEIKMVSGDAQPRLTSLLIYR